jgi:ubiquinone biosynthesis protein
MDGTFQAGRQGPPTRPQPSFADPGRSAPSRWIAPDRFADIFARRGGIYIKIAQFFAMRPDLLPQDETFAWPEARQILLEDLQREPEQAFASIDHTPLAAASLSQIHLARTLEGDEVAVKVQRPGIAEAVRRQLRSARGLLRLLETSGWIPGVRADDLSRELSKVVRIHEVYAGKVAFRVPRPYVELSGRRVVTMEYLRGVPMSELLRFARSGSMVRIEALGFDAGELACGIVNALLNQIFRYRLFHGDPHPGNMLAMEGNVVGFVDFGLVHALEPAIQKRLGNYVEAVYRRDPERIYRGLVDILEHEAGADLAAFRAELFEATREWTRASALDADTAGDRSPIAHYMVAVLRSARRHRLRLPPSALAMYRSMLTADALAGALGNPSALTFVGRRFFGQLRIEQWFESLMPDEVGAKALDIVGMAAAAPNQLGGLLAEVSDGRFVLPVRTSDSPEDRRDANNRAKLLSMAVLSVAVAILTSGAVLARAGDAVVYSLGTLLALNYVAVVWLWRRIR